ncbi:MAG: hypothetical protein AABY18_04400 [Candidatus Thermoplasmatota archaeon]
MTTATQSADDGLLDEPHERANVTRLIRWVAMFVAWPSLSIGLAFLVFTDPSEHWLHIAGLVPLGVAACVLFALAPRIAKHYVPQ